MNGRNFKKLSKYMARPCNLWFSAAKSSRTSGVPPSRNLIQWAGRHATVMSIIIMSGCGDSSVIESPVLARRTSSIIDGDLAPENGLNHTGALLARLLNFDVSLLLCTATVISPETAVTAKHCLASIETYDDPAIELSLAFGPNFREPLSIAKVVATEQAPAGKQPGALGDGRDVAVLHFDAPVEVEPAAIGAFKSRFRGVSMNTLGYGVSGATSGPVDGLRRRGRETVTATRGRLFRALYGNFESYLEVELTGQSTENNDLDRLINMLNTDPTLGNYRDLRRKYNRTRLIKKHEAVTHTLAGDTRNCSGDSGGPLALVDNEGSWVTYGVMSGGAQSGEGQCDFGQVFATFGPTTFGFLQNAMGWTDPCGKIGDEGVCEGSVLRRCETQLGEQLRRLTDRNCASEHLACEMTTNGGECVE